uniref:NR LBD domain-containing protein n=1 Tax=Caenorhabditis japonica TaxID=281687 RepID=A0A8R1IB85_CAEJA
MEVKTDTKLLWRLCETAFPEFEQLGKHDKKVLFFNFYTKWSILEMIIFAVKKNDPLSFFTPSGSITTSITKFYKQEKESLSEKDVERIFQPYWNYHLEQVIQPIAKMGYGNMENMALFGILLWDTAYANVSEQLAEVCRAMRNIMLRELSSYLEQERGDTGSRFFETLDTLNLIERAEHKCQEEMQLCGMYGVEVDDEMQTYANVSEQLAEVCRAMRNIMLRELSSYLEQERGDTGSRFFETLDTLNLIERAEHKCQEEMQLCGMYGVEVDDEMRSMWEKF